MPETQNAGPHRTGALWNDQVKVRSAPVHSVVVMAMMLVCVTHVVSLARVSRRGQGLLPLEA